MEPSTDVTACIVAPAWLHEPLGVLLQAAPGVRLWASTTSVEALFWSAVQPPPELVLLYASSEQTASQVEVIKNAWPDTLCIVVIEHTKLRSVAQDAGADEVLLEGRAPRRLVEAVGNVCERRADSIRERDVHEEQVDLKGGR